MAAKVKDGLFIGDEETSRSEVFINDNKISNLINLSGGEVKNHWESYGLVYLTYNWEDSSNYKLLTGAGDPILHELLDFIDVSLSHGISVLMFSTKGLCRCALASCLYLMMKYYWGFEKAYDYVYTKKPDIKISKNFIQQMFSLDIKLLQIRQNNLILLNELLLEQEMKRLKSSGGSPTREKSIRKKLQKQKVFQIESSMTINDIACLLPKNEAKRWCSWDPSYIIYDYQKLLMRFVEENNLKSGNLLKNQSSPRKKLILRDKNDEKSNEEDYCNDEFEEIESVSSSSKVVDEEEEKAKSSIEFDFDPLSIDPKKYDEKIQSILIERDEIIKKIHLLKIPSHITLFSSVLSQPSPSISSFSAVSNSFNPSQILEDIEEELVMIFSYINGKNTISSLPGPYLDQETDKDFKLRFNSTTFYEDFGPSLILNSFAVLPSSSTSTSPSHSSKSIYSLKLKPKYGILKGSNSKKLYETSLAQSQDKSKNRIDKNGQEYKSSYQIDYKSTENLKSNKSNSPLNNSPPSSITSSISSPSSDLFSFVGMTSNAAPKQTDSSSKVDSKDEKKIREDKSSDVFSTPSLFTTSAGLSAEDRLRKLMADMQRQSHFPQHLYEGSGGGNIDNYFNSPHMDAYSTIKQKASLSETPQTDSNCFMSLYDIANLNPNNIINSSNNSQQFNSTSGAENSLEEFDLESESIHDPLSAFDTKDIQYNEEIRENIKPTNSKDSNFVSSTSRLNPTPTSRPQSSISRSSALRARHDLPTASSTRPSSATSRQTIGTTRQSLVPSSASINSINSVSSIKSTNSSSKQPNTTVGNGTSSSAKIYRHGSPAPNTSRSTINNTSNLKNKTQNPTSNSSVGSIKSVNSSISVTSIGSIPKNRFSSPLTSSTSTSFKKNSYGGSTTDVPTSRTNPSPLRASYNGSSTSGSSNSRPSSPSVSNSRRQSIGERPQTPTKTWRF